MEYGKPFLLNIFTFNDLHGYLVENPIQTLIIRRHIVFLVWFIKRAWAACDINSAFYCFLATRFETTLVIMDRTFNNDLKNQSSANYKGLKEQLEETVCQMVQG